MCWQVQKPNWRVSLSAGNRAPREVGDPAASANHVPDLLRRIRRRRGFRRPVQRIESGLRLRRNIAEFVFPEAEKKKGNGGSKDQKLCVSTHLDLWLPAKQLRGQKKGKNGPGNQRTKRDEDVAVPEGRRFKNGAAESLDQVSGGQKQGDLLHHFGQENQRKSSARKKNQGKPEKLVDDLSFLHGVGDAGNDQAQRRERNRAHADQNECGQQVAKIRDVKDGTREDEFQENGRKHEDVVGDHAGSKHVAGRHGSHMEAAKDALLAKHNESRAEPPKAAHNGEGHDRTQEEFDDLGLAFGKDPGIEKEKGKRHEDREEQKHFIAQRELNAHAGECGEVSQSRSLLPVISMNTSSREGEAISRLTSSLPWASRCLTMATMVCGGRCE